MDTSKLKKNNQTTDWEKLVKDYEDSTAKSLATIENLTLALALKTERGKELEKRITSAESHVKYLEGRIPSSESYYSLSNGMNEIKTKLLDSSKARDYGAVCLLFFFFLQAIPLIIKIIPVDIVACLISQEIPFFFPSIAGTVIPFLMLYSKQNRKTQILIPYMIVSILITYSQCFLCIVPWTSGTIGIIIYGMLHGFVWFIFEFLYNKREVKHE